MLRKLNKIMAIAMVLILVAVSYTPAVEAKANEANGKGYKSTKTILKKLKKNAMSYYPNPDSPQLTYGYALKKIKDFVESDPNAYVGESAGWVELIADKGYKTKFVGGTKSQRKALKWGVDIGLVIHFNEDSSICVNALVRASSISTYYEYCINTGYYSCQCPSSGFFYFYAKENNDVIIMESVSMP